MSFDDDDSAPAYVLPMAGEREIGDRILAVRTAAGLTQQAFADRLGKTTRGAVGNWERGQGIKRENLAAIAEVFQVNYVWLADGIGSMERPDPSVREPVNAYVRDKLPFQRNTIPLYGHAVGGEDGEFVLNGTELDNITAPPSLSAAKGAYAVTVAGDSMEPRYEDGETVYVDPSRRCVRGNYVVAQIQYEETGPRLAYIKRFIRHTDKELVLEQFNPPKELRFQHKNVLSVHYIVMGGRVT